MDPIAPLNMIMDKTEELLGHSPHPAIIALPIGAWAVSNVCDVLGLLTGEERYDDAARVSMAVELVGAAGAIATGLRDYGFIPSERPSHETATQHRAGQRGRGQPVYHQLHLADPRARGGAAHQPAGPRLRPGRRCPDALYSLAWRRARRGIRRGREARHGAPRAGRAGASGRRLGPGSRTTGERLSPRPALRTAPCRVARVGAGPHTAGWWAGADSTHPMRTQQESRPPGSRRRRR